MSVLRRFERMKKFVASVGAISLVSLGLLCAGPALAAQADQNDMTSNSMTSMKARVAEMEATLASMSQQDGRPAQANSAWSQYIRVSGGINVDGKLAGTLGNNDTDADGKTSGRFTGVNIKTIGINDAYLNIDGEMNNWLSGRVGLTYNAVSANYNLSALADDSATGASTGTALYMDQAYVTVADFDKQPYYLRAGVQYVDFGDYELHPITKSFTQEMTEINDVAVQIGLLDSTGINVSAFMMPTPVTKTNSAGHNTNHNQLNYGGSVHYSGPMRGESKFDLEAGYLANIVSVEGFQRYDNDSAYTTYSTAVPVMFLGAGIQSGPFAVSAKYAEALKSFSDSDAVYYQDDKSAKPATAELMASYNFKYFENRENTVSVGYARSSEASFMGLPEDRYYVDYSVGLYKNTGLTLQWSHDVDYNSSNLVSTGEDYATGRNYNVVTARLAVNFG